MSEEKDAKIQELEAEIARLKEENSKLQETVQWMHDLIWKMVRDREGQKGDPADGTYACSDVREDQDQSKITCSPIWLSFILWRKAIFSYMDRTRQERYN